jgi:glycosidase
MHMKSPLSPGLNNPNLLEIHTAIFLRRLREKYNREMTLGTVPLEEWSMLTSKGFDFLWSMGVWERSPASKTSALSDAELRKAYGAALPGWREDDVIGSPYAVYSYRPDPRFGNEDDLAKLKNCLNENGIGLILDFVPNHLAADHPWTSSTPERFVQGTQTDLKKNPDIFFTTGRGDILAHGKDPYFPSWKDTVQLNYFSDDTKKALIQEIMNIAPYADGLRCDMAMLILNSVFEQTWAPFLKKSKPSDGEFWSEAIECVKNKYPSFIFIAEAYWDLEWKLQQLGFDYTYDKKLYDLLLNAPARQIHEHLWAESSYQGKSVRFIENHDEPRAAAIFGAKKSLAAASIASTVPGMHLLHDGQMEGRTLKLPVQLQMQKEEKPDRTTKRFYDRLLKYLNHDLIRHGNWKLLDPAPAWESNLSYKNLLSWIWNDKERFKLIIVNYSAEQSQGRIYIPRSYIQEEIMVFHDVLTKTSYERDRPNLLQYGLYIDLNPWQIHLFDLV